LYDIDEVLDGLTSRLLVALVIISSAISALARFGYLYFMDNQTSFIAIYSIGFMGDVLGAFMCLYLVKLFIFWRAHFYQ